MNDHAIKRKCILPKLFNIKDFFRRIDECHDELQKDIDKMKTTINGDDTWMTHKPHGEK
jgi:hypothetical protein